MLKSLYAKNFALISEVQVTFEKGLNVITGETGAGKSILLGALGGILGDKMGKDMIRSGEEKCILEAELDNLNSDELNKIFLENDIEYDDNGILIRREISQNGRSRSFVNDTPVPLSVLVDIGDLLVDLHGQHQHQLLLQTRRHIDYLDAYGIDSSLLSNVKRAYSDFIETRHQLEELRRKEQQLIQSRDLLQFQLKEISAVDPQPGEDEELEGEERILRNAELLYELCNSLLFELYEKEGSVSEVLRKSEQNLNKLADIDPAFASMKKECFDSRIVIDELANSLRNYIEGITFDPGRLENIRQRLASLSGLKKKYHGTIDAILQHKEKAARELALIENLDDKIVELENEIEKKRTVLAQLCKTLSEKRRATGKELAAAVTEHLFGLGMPNARFETSQTFKGTEKDNYIIIDGERIEVGPKGIDKIEFIISTNPGEELKPLSHVASGGEISRIMLALKALLARADQIPVLVFDEIDIGISGRIAQAVGKSLRRLAGTHQVICITHLPQIASMAHHHFLVEKRVEGNATKTNIRKLDDNERVHQVAQLFGGETVTDAHILSAAELIKEAENFAN